MRQTVVEVHADANVAAVLDVLDRHPSDVVAVRFDGPDGPLWQVLPVAQLRARLEVVRATAVGGGDRAVGDVLGDGPVARTTQRDALGGSDGPVLVLDRDQAVGWIPASHARHGSRADGDGATRGGPTAPPGDRAEEAVGPEDHLGSDATEAPDVVDRGPRRSRGGLFGDRDGGGSAPRARSRSIRLPGDPDPTSTEPPPGPRKRRSISQPRTEERPRRSAPPPPPEAIGPPARTARPRPPEAAPPAPTREAHARVEAPERATTSTEIDVVVGLASTRQPGVLGESIDLPIPLPADRSTRLTIQIAGDGFTFPDGIRRRLDVDPDDLDAATTSFVAVTPDVTSPTFATLQVDYAVDDQPVGRAWRAVLVEPVDAPAPADTPVPSPGQLPVHLHPRAPVDLTITILVGDDEDTLLWLFATPHDVDLPDEQVTTRLPAAGAREFSLQQVAQVEKSAPALVEQRLRGISRAISGAIPGAAWRVLRDVWRRVAASPDDTGPPSVLIATSEAWVPWELASVEERFLGDADLLDDDAPATLGCQVRLGRWIPPGPDRAPGVVHPEHPPPDDLDLHTMAVVVGQYGDPMDSWAELPEARVEGDTLVDRYPSVELDADLEHVLALLGDEIELPGDLAGPVDVIHIACHGKIDTVDPRRNGIVLDDDVARLDELTVRGGSLDRGRPLVFVNACQLATTSTELLGDQGGLAAAFLSIGARGYIAPLWSVEDTVARDIALDVHRLCLEEGVPVGEAMRRVRGRFADDPTSSTPLAYVYYGHPELVMARRDDR